MPAERCQIGQQREASRERQAGRGKQKARRERQAERAKRGNKIREASREGTGRQAGILKDIDANVVNQAERGKQKKQAERGKPREGRKAKEKGGVTYPNIGIALGNHINNQSTPAEPSTLNLLPTSKLQSTISYTESASWQLVSSPNTRLVRLACSTLRSCTRIPRGTFTVTRSHVANARAPSAKVCARRLGETLSNLAERGAYHQDLLALALFPVICKCGSQRPPGSLTNGSRIEVDGFSQPLIQVCIGSSPTGTGTAISSNNSNNTCSNDNNSINYRRASTATAATTGMTTAATTQRHRKNKSNNDDNSNNDTNNNINNVGKSTVLGDIKKAMNISEEATKRYVMVRTFLGSWVFHTHIHLYKY
jgi:hypothetical protein